MTQVEPSAPVPVVLDTDIGTDIDDLLALVIAATHPRLDLRAVTTVNGDTQLRARIARSVLDLLGRRDVPVGAGAGVGLSHVATGSMPGGFGHEGRGFDLANVGPQPPADEVLAHALVSSEQPVTLCALGAYTNIAALVISRPELTRQIAAVHATGGCLAAVRVDGVTVASSGFREYNVGCDPLATAVIFASPLPLRLVSVDITASARLTPAEIEGLTHMGEIGTLLADQIEFFLEGKRAELIARGRPTSLALVALHDPTVVATLAQPEIATYQELRVSAFGGPGAVRTTRWPHGRSLEALASLDRDRLLQVLLSSIPAAAGAQRLGSQAKRAGHLSSNDQ